MLTNKEYAVSSSKNMLTNKGWIFFIAQPISEAENTCQKFYIWNMKHWYEDVASHICSQSLYL